MDFPVFHLDFLGNRMLIATIAVLHVIINHSLAVGAMPLVAAMEWWCNGFFQCYRGRTTDMLRQ